jgi:hypothetical protein
MQIDQTPEQRLISSPIDVVQDYFKDNIFGMPKEVVS